MMIIRFSCLLAVALAVGVIATNADAIESSPNRNLAPRTCIVSDTFDHESLGDDWSFDDPNHNDAFSVSARPGWLQIEVNGPDEDIWEEGRGGAPLLRKSVRDVRRDFSIETYVDLATSNGGYPVLNSIGGLIIACVDDPAPFLITLGLQHNWSGGTEVILQKPGTSFKWACPGANAAYLRLDRDIAKGTWTGYHKNHKENNWIRLTTVADTDLSAGATDETLEVGLFAKTWDPNLGSRAKIDFAYIGVEEREGAGTRRADPTTPTEDGEEVQEVELASLRPFCVSGKELPVLNGYREAELLRHSGKGCLTHMWFGGDWPGYDHTRIRIYVDGEQEPSIEMELGLGHGCGFGDEAAPWGGSKLGKTGHPSGLYNTYKIPFGEGIRVTAQRDENSPDGAPFWWIVRGTENLPVRIAGVRLPDNARLRLHKLEGHVAQPMEEFALCDIPGAGELYQVTMAADGLRDNGNWMDICYLEAIMRAYIDGEPRPLLLSSGLEDYFLGTYYFNRGRYANNLAGLTHFDKNRNTFSAYRFHDEDPLFFQNGLRLTCRCGEEVAGKKLHDPPETEYTTYTWVYQW